MREGRLGVERILQRRARRLTLLICLARDSVCVCVGFFFIKQHAARDKFDMITRLLRSGF